MTKAIELSQLGSNIGVVDGKVGIGATSPQGLFHLKSTTAEVLQIMETSTGTVKLYANNDDFIVNADQHRFRSENGSTEYLRIKANGNVGIGTDNPSADFVIANETGTTTNGLEFDVDNSQGGNRLLSYDRQTSLRTVFNLDASEFNYKQVGNVTKVKIDSNGNVGIGTTDPQHKLHVKGHIRLDGTSAALNNNYSLIYQNSSSTVDYGLQIKHYQGDTGDVDASIHIGGNGATREDNIIFYRSNGSGASTETMRIDESGNVGIGTDNPQAKLTIKGSQNADPSASKNPISDIYIQNVGGTPGLDNYGGSIGFSRINTGRRGAMIAEVQSSSDADQGGLAFFTKGNGNVSTDIVAEKVRIDHNGNVGIGVTNPSTFAGDCTLALNSSGGARIGLNATGRTYYIGGDSGSDRLEIGRRVSSNSADSADIVLNSSGNVGIGTNSPDQKLHVEGAVRINPNDGDGVTLLHLDTERAWTFKQRGTGSTTDLSLRSTVGNKYFNIENTDEEINFRFFAATDISGSIFVVGEDAGRVSGIDLQTGNILVASATFSSNINVPYLTVGTSGWTGATTDWNTYGFQHRIKSNSGGTSRVTIDGYSGEYFCVENGGNVGIGTNDPGHRLHVVEESASTYGAGVARFTYIDSNAANDAGSATTHFDAKFKPGHSYFKSFITGNSTDFLIVDQDNSSSRASFAVEGSAGSNKVITAMSNGNVGIGTDDPNAKLHIQGTSVQVAGAFGSNVTYGGRSIQTNHDIRATSMRGGVLVRNMNDYRSETESASFMHYDAYNTTAKSYAFRVAAGTTLADKFYVKNNGDTYVAGSFDTAATSLERSLIAQGIANSMGWIPGYHNSDYADVYWDFTERAVKLHSTADSSIGMVKAAIPVKPSQTIRATVTVKVGDTSAAGLYLRLAGIAGNLPDGKTHVIHNASANPDHQEEDDYHVTDWIENNAIGSGWKTYERDYTVPSSGSIYYFSLYVLNWTGQGTNPIWIKDASLVVLN